jgi:hypothetical protein
LVSDQLGTHKEGGDSIFDSGETVVDFEPSDKERLRAGLEAFLICLPAAAFGVYSGFQKDKHLTEKERREINRELTKPLE